MTRYLITYESADWCGAADTHCVVYAESPEQAEILASDHMQSEMLELFSEEYAEEEDYDVEPAYSVTSIEVLDENHPDWKYYVDPTQSQFYPEVNWE